MEAVIFVIILPFVAGIVASYLYMMKEDSCSVVDCTIVFTVVWFLSTLLGMSHYG